MSSRQGKLTNDGWVYNGDIGISIVPSGRGLMEYSTGAKYDGQWKNGKRHGKGKVSASHVNICFVTITHSKHWSFLSLQVVKAESTKATGKMATLMATANLHRWMERCFTMGIGLLGNVWMAKVSSSTQDFPVLMK